MEEKTFLNLQSVSDYLRIQGWKVSKSTVYDHAKARKIKPRADGLFHLADVEIYAESYLSKKNMPKSSQSDTMQRRRNEAEARKMEAQARHWEIKSQVEAGAYVEREAFERALTQRAAIFKNDLESFARSHAPEICHLVKGSEGLIPALIEHLLDEFAIFLNRYSEERKFTVPERLTAVPAELDQDDDDDDENEADFLDNENERKQQ